MIAANPSLKAAPRALPLHLVPGPGQGGEAADHWHLWRLPDGTGLHVPFGTLVRDPDAGRACCHLCGRWYRSLGAHVRVHGHTANSYREAMGLFSTRPLAAPDLSATIARRQRAAYQRSAEVRDRLAPGRELARTGALSSRAQAVADSPQRRTARHAQLDAGRATAAARRAAGLRARLDGLAATSLEDYLRRAYAEGASLDTLGRATGLGRARLREAMRAAGVPIRPSGVNTPRGRRSRAVTAEREAASRVGTADLTAWLRDRHAQGWTLGRLGDAVGHSDHWVRWRLASEP